MNLSGLAKRSVLVPVGAAVIALLALIFWFASGPTDRLSLRIPGTDRGPDSETGAKANPVLAGKLMLGEGQPANLPGNWPGFRGPGRDAIGRDPCNPLRSWKTGEPIEPARSRNGSRAG